MKRDAIENWRMLLDEWKGFAWRWSMIWLARNPTRPRPPSIVVDRELLARLRPSLSAAAKGPSLRVLELRRIAPWYATATRASRDSAIIRRG